MSLLWLICMVLTSLAGSAQAQGAVTCSVQLRGAAPSNISSLSLAQCNVRCTGPSRPALTGGSAFANCSFTGVSFTVVPSAIGLTFQGVKSLQLINSSVTNITIPGSRPPAKDTVPTEDLHTLVAGDAILNFIACTDLSVLSLTISRLSAAASWGGLRIVNTSAIFQRVTCTDNTATLGACAAFIGSTVSLDSISCQRNSALQGGAFWSLDSTFPFPIASSDAPVSSYANNTADEAGGAIFLTSATAAMRSRSYITDANFIGNTASLSGGAIYGGDATLVYIGVNCTFTSNQATSSLSGDGGAISLGRQSNLTALQSNFTQNTAVAYGGAVHVGPDSWVFLQFCRFTDNQCGSADVPCYGGAIAAGSAASFDFTTGTLTHYGNVTLELRSTTFTNSTLSNSSFLGAAIFLGLPFSLNASTCRWVGNSATHARGGGIGADTATLPDNSQSSVTLTDCAFTANVAASGSAMYLPNFSVLRMTRCDIFDHRMLATEELFGAVYVGRSSMTTLDQVQFRNNSVVAASGGSGAALYVLAANEDNPRSGWDSLTATSCTWTSNSAGFGGAVYAGLTTSTWSNCTFVDNIATSQGGALLLPAQAAENGLASITFSGCTFHNNSAGNVGGAMYAQSFSAVAFINSTVTANSAVRGGVAYIAKDAQNNANTTLRFSACTLSANTASDAGAVAYLEPANFLIVDNGTAVSGNVGNTGGAFVTFGGSSRITFLDSSFNSNAAGGTGTGSTGGVLSSDSDRIIIQGCNFNDNVADTMGGVIAATGSVLDVRASNFVGNSLTLNPGSADPSMGAAVYADGGAVSITGGRFQSNAADTGALVVLLANLTLSSTSFSSNVGGAIYASNRISDGNTGNTSRRRLQQGASQPMYVKQTGGVLQDNTANTGGALQVVDSSLSIVGAAFLNNTAATSGGAVAISGSPQAIIRNSTFIANRAANDANSIAHTSSTTTLVDTSFGSDLSNPQQQSLVRNLTLQSRSGGVTLSDVASGSGSLPALLALQKSGDLSVADESALASYIDALSSSNSPLAPPSPPASTGGGLTNSQKRLTGGLVGGVGGALLLVGIAAAILLTHRRSRDNEFSAGRSPKPSEASDSMDNKDPRFAGPPFGQSGNESADADVGSGHRSSDPNSKDDWNEFCRNASATDKSTLSLLSAQVSSIGVPDIPEEFVAAWNAFPGAVLLMDTTKAGLIGENALGQARRGTCNGEPIALTVHPLPFPTTEWSVTVKKANAAIEAFGREATRINSIAHRHIARLFSARLNLRLVAVAQDSFDCSLAQLTAKVGPNIPLSQMLAIAAGISRALTAVHPAIVHAKLRPQVVHITTAGVVKVSDFCVSHLLASMIEERKLDSSIVWSAPEVIGGATNAATAKSDIYSLGMILWHMLCGGEPWVGKPLDTIRVDILRDVRPPLPQADDRVPKELLDLIEACWHPDPAERPDAPGVTTWLLSIDALYMGGALAEADAIGM